jgi:hypothetical protein
MIPILLMSALPFVSTDPAGVASVDISGRVRLEVISADTLVRGAHLVFDYEVQGLRMVSDLGADTLGWISDPPGTALASAAASGAATILERRTLGVIACTESFVGMLVSVSSSRDNRGTSRYTTYRTWLLAGIPIDLDAVVQRDSLFEATLRSSLGAPQGRDLDSWLWRRGFWLDPESFLILPGSGGAMTLRMGLPSWQGSDSLLVVDLDLGKLHTASAAMLD